MASVIEFSVCLSACLSVCLLVLGKFSNFFLQYKSAAVRAVISIRYGSTYFGHMLTISDLGAGPQSRPLPLVLRYIHHVTGVLQGDINITLTYTFILSETYYNSFNSVCASIMIM